MYVGYSNNCRKSRRRGAWLKVWPTPSLDLDMTPTDGAAPNYKHWPVLACGSPGAMWNTGPAPGPTQDTPDSARLMRRTVWVGYLVHFVDKDVIILRRAGPV